MEYLLGFIIISAALVASTVGKEASKDLYGYIKKTLFGSNDETTPEPQKPEPQLVSKNFLPEFMNYGVLKWTPEDKVYESKKQGFKMLESEKGETFYRVIGGRNKEFLMTQEQFNKN